MLSRLVMAFLPTSRHLLISWLQSPSAVILEPTPLKELHSNEGDGYILKEKICVSEEYQREKKNQGRWKIWTFWLKSLCLEDS